MKIKAKWGFIGNARLLGVASAKVVAGQVFDDVDDEYAHTLIGKGLAQPAVDEAPAKPKPTAQRTNKPAAPKETKPVEPLQTQLVPTSEGAGAAPESNTAPADVAQSEGNDAADPANTEAGGEA
ncbi:DUF7302 family protein [Stutzerimonas stutzeri]|uniref:DUF7302 family protein n=1 Tax=Stutzerimonas stutzeri TaxID=316 RepID=UPI001C2E8B41|nr:hypothetical protein [Stutzerimonas stutzeri]